MKSRKAMQWKGNKAEECQPVELKAETQERYHFVNCMWNLITCSPYAIHIVSEMYVKELLLFFIILSILLYFLIHTLQLQSCSQLDPQFPVPNVCFHLTLTFYAYFIIYLFLGQNSIQDFKPNLNKWSWK